MYSQNGEDDLILNLFSGKESGTILDIGAFDGKTFSNSLALIEKGWKAIMVEGSAFPFSSLFNLYKGNPNITLVNAMITIEENSTPLKMYESPNSLVSTVDTKHFLSWKNRVETFNHPPFYEMYTSTISFKNLLTWIKQRNISLEFVSIDVEGFSATLSMNFNPDDFNTKVIIIEHDNMQIQVENYFSNYGFKICGQTSENIIMERI